MSDRDQSRRVDIVVLGVAGPIHAHATPALPIPAPTTPAPTVVVTLIALLQVILKHPAILRFIVILRASTHRCSPSRS